MRVAVAALAAALAIVVALPASVGASQSCGALTVRGGSVTISATFITTYNHLSCKRGRQVVRAYFRKQLSDFEGCAVPAKNEPYDGCAVLSYSCVTKGQKSLKGRCEGPDERVVRFNEQDKSTG
jgi:hypothetical protein